MTLRALEPEDLDLLYQIENNRDLWQVGATNVPYSRYTLHDYIATSSDDIFADRQVRLIIENEQGDAVGIVDLVHFDPQHLRAEVGIVILPAFRRMGYALSAIQALCDYAVRIVHLHQLYAVVDNTNQAALSLFEKAGFKSRNTLTEWLFDGREYHDAVLMQRFL